MNLQCRKYSDTERMDFLENNDVHVNSNSYFTIFTQHVDRHNYTLRDFCDYALELKLMLEANNLDSHTWFWLYSYHTIYINAWNTEKRAITESEKKSIEDEQREYNKHFNESWNLV